jgi:prolyl-tRNA synthetase
LSGSLGGYSIQVPTGLRAFVRTLRERPSDAEVTSHRLSCAGYIRRQGPGNFAWLPLGLRVKRRIETIIREEMDGIGAQEVHFRAWREGLRGHRSVGQVR